MHLRFKFTSLAMVLALASTALAADGPYNEAADAKLEISATLAQATQARVPVLVVFGANWCGDCKMLDIAMKTGTSAELIKHDYRVVKVDVGRFDRNVDIAERYGVPLKKGIPAVAVLSADGSVLYATTGGELADARKMGEDGVLEFFKRVSVKPRPKS